MLETPNCKCELPYDTTPATLSELSSVVKQFVKREQSFKRLVQNHGDFVLDYVECKKNSGEPCWFVRRGIGREFPATFPSGLHNTPRQAWEAAAKCLKLI